MLNLCIFSGQNNCHLLELFLWMLGSFLIGWFLHRYFSKSKFKEALDDCNSKCRELERKNEYLSNNKTTASATSSKKSNVVASSLGAATAATTTSAAAITPVDSSVKDDLKKVEGIGPKIQELLNTDGIWSFAQLANSTVERIQGVLDAAGPRYRMHNPKTWPEQAALARDGKWDKLKELQDKLHGGV